MVISLSIPLNSALFARAHQLALALRRENVDPNEFESVNDYLCHLLHTGQLCGKSAQQGRHVVARAIQHLDKLLAPPQPFLRSDRTAAYWRGIVKSLKQWRAPDDCQAALLCMLYAARLLRALRKNPALAGQLPQ